MNKRTENAISRLVEYFKDYDSIKYIGEGKFLNVCSNCGKETIYDLNKLRDKKCSTEREFKIVCCSKECFSEYKKKQLKEKIVCLETEEKFNSIREVQNRFGIQRKLLVDILDRNKKLSFKGYHFVRSNELNCSCKEMVVKLESGRKNFPTSKYSKNEVICLETGEVFKGEYAAAIKFNTVSNRIKRLCTGEEKSIKRKYHFCYLKDLQCSAQEKIEEIEKSKKWKFKNKIFENFDLDNLLDICFEKNSYFQKMIEIINNPTSGEVNELHHIIPRSYFKKNGYTVVDKGNLISLSASQHLQIHLYAAKCAKEIIRKEMLKAYIYMSNLNKLNGEEYESLKKELKTINGEKVICLETGEVFNSKREVSRVFGVDRKSLLNVLKGKQISIKNLHFCNYEESLLNEENRKLKIQELESKKSKIICLETKEIFNSISDCERKYGIPHSVISNMLSGKLLSAGNFHFEKLKDNFEYTDSHCQETISNLESKRNNIKHSNCKKKIFNIELNKTFNSINEALRFLGKTNNGKFNKLIKKTNYVYGYHWKVIE